jgi:CO/xanthine dehydrogenase Mo-binding subunit
VGKEDPDLRLALGDLADGSVHLATIDPSQRFDCRTPYSDQRTPNVNGEAIVTGTLRYTGDLFPGEVAYGSWLLPEFHTQLTQLDGADLGAAAGVPGVEKVQEIWNSAFVVGDSFSSVERGLRAVRPSWKKPDRDQKLEVEREIRAGAWLKKPIEEKGEPERQLEQGSVVLKETYVTQYASQVPIETETAIAEVNGDRATIWASMQAPFRTRRRVADRLEVAEENVHVVSMPVGGGFGVKMGTKAPQMAAEISRAVGHKVKLVFSRPHQFVGDARFKEAVVADISSSVTRDGKWLARTLDLYQDEGFGSTDTYDIPHVRTRLFRARMPARHATMRGTSFVQTCFAVESHTDMLAKKVGLDPVEFRKKNLAVWAFGPLLDACAEKIGYGIRQLPDDHGIGFAICHHGGRQLGAVAAHVSVNRSTGVVKVEQLMGAFDIGLVINHRTLTANTKGAMIWGLGYALFEEVRLDGHKAYTRNMADYHIPRFSDVPPIDTVFLDNLIKQERPRGCGELPVVPTVGAIANAVHHAVGIRFHTLPITPERVLTHLRDLSR